MLLHPEYAEVVDVGANPIPSEAAPQTDPVPLLDGLSRSFTGVLSHIAETGAADGYNIGINVGEAAGQTVAHAHLHVIPRLRGDVPDPRGGIRWVIPAKAQYWEMR